MTVLLGGFYSIDYRINYVAPVHFSSNIKEKLDDVRYIVYTNEISKHTRLIIDRCLLY